MAQAAYAASTHTPTHLVAPGSLKSDAEKLPSPAITLKSEHLKRAPEAFSAWSQPLYTGRCYNLMDGLEIRQKYDRRLNLRGLIPHRRGAETRRKAKVKTGER